MINIIILNMKKMSKDISNLLICGITILLLSACTSNKSVQMKTEKTVRIDTTFHPNGKIREIFTTIDSIKHGFYIGYNSNGKKSVETTYIDGEWYGPYTTYYASNGNVNIRAFCINGMWDGEFISYYENGSINQILYFKDGKMNGLFYQYSEDGELCQKILYENDEIKEIIFNNRKFPLP